MATRGRDIELRLVTDLSRFDADDAARDLDQLADRAEQADDALRDVDRAADRAGDGLREMGRDADAAGRDVHEAMGEVRDGARGAANEALGAFNGSFDSIGGAAQGMMAELGTTLGPAAMGPLLAGAALIGAAMEGAAKETERAAAQADAYAAQIQELGQVATDLDPRAVSEFVTGMLGDEEGRASLRRMRDDADKLGVSLDTLARAHAGDAAATAEVTRAYQRNRQAQGELAETNDRWAQKFGVNSDSWLASSQAISSETRQLVGGMTDVADAASIASDAVGGLTTEQLELSETVRAAGEQIVTAADDFEQNMARFPNSIQAQADAAAQASTTLADSWADNISDVNGLADQLIAGQEEERAKLEEYNRNIADIYAKGGVDAVEFAASQNNPADAAKAMAQMSPEDVAEIGTNYRTNMELASKEIIPGLVAGFKGTESVAHDAGVRDGKEYSKAFNSAVKLQPATPKPLPTGTAEQGLLTLFGTAAKAAKVVP